MNINSLAASRKFSDEESSAEDVVDTWEDLVDDEEDQPVGAKSTGALEGKSAKEDLVRDSDLQVAADLFGTPAAKDEGLTKLPSADDKAEDPLNYLAEPLKVVSEKLNYAMISGNSELVRCIMKKLFFTVEADTEDKILDEIVALVAKVPKPTAGGSAVQTQAAQDNEEKAGAPGRVINESNTATVAKSTAKKKYPNFGTSKKKFNKQWLDDEYGSMYDAYDEGD